MISMMKHAALGVVTLALILSMSPARAEVVGCEPVYPLSKKTATFAGYVKPDGTIAAGSGFTVSHTGTGTYTVTYPQSDFPGGFPAMVAQGWDINGAIPVVNLFKAVCVSGSCTFEIHIFDLKGDFSDNGFVFNIVQAH